MLSSSAQLTLWAMLADVDGSFRLELEIANERNLLEIPCVERDHLLLYLRTAQNTAGGCARLAAITYRDRAPHRGHALWARLLGSGPSAALERFRPPPTIVLRDGMLKRRTALWALSRPLDETWLYRANRRLAYALGGVAAIARDPEHAFLVAGACGPGGRVRCEWLGDGLYLPRAVVGRLRDVPEPRRRREAA